MAHQFFLIFKGVACVVSNLSAPLPNPKETSLHRSKLRGAGRGSYRLVSCAVCSSWMTAIARLYAVWSSGKLMPSSSSKLSPSSTPNW